MLPVYNSEDIVGEVIEHLLSQGIELVVLDNGSTDASYEICKKFSDRGLIELAKFKTSTYQWPKILRMMYDMALVKSPDWVLRTDSDEFLESGISNTTLKEAISQADADGYNLIQFDGFEFFLTDNDNESATTIKEKLRYYSWQFDFLYRAWKYMPGIRVEYAGGHYPVFPEEQKYRILPRKFVARHYRFRSKEQARKKVANFLPRINGTPEKEIGWFKTYKKMQEYNDFPLIADHGILNKYEEDNKWNYERKFCPYLARTPPTREELFSHDGSLINRIKSMIEFELELKNSRKRILELENQLAELQKKY